MCFGFGVELQVCVTHALACLAHSSTHYCYIDCLHHCPLHSQFCLCQSHHPYSVWHTACLSAACLHVWCHRHCVTSVPGVCTRYTSLCRAGLNRWWQRGCIFTCVGGWRQAPVVACGVVLCAKLPCAHPVRVSQCVYVTACGMHVTGVLKRVYVGAFWSPQESSAEI